MAGSVIELVSSDRPADAARPLQFLASAPRGLADLLARELTELGAENVKERSTSVAFSGTLKTAYRACLMSRVANRVFLELATFEAANAQELYAGASRIDWSQHLGAGATLACEFSGRHPTIAHTHFGALKLKDAVVDVMRTKTGARPDIAPERPSVRVHSHAQGTRITISLDLSGESLHRRGYRGAAGEAPLKENVAAGLLLRAGWPQMAAEGGQFLDPLCGSGTLVIEAALIALNRAPAAQNDYFGFQGWRGHDEQLWLEVVGEAKRRSTEGSAVRLTIRGQDKDANAIRNARENAKRAGVADLVQFEVSPLASAAPSASDGNTQGLLCANPPYGVRLEDLDTARALHRQLGAVLRERFQGWDAAILTGAPELGKELGIRAFRTHTLWNGALECRLLRLKVDADSVREPGRFAKPGSTVRESPGARMVANRLAKNLKRLGTWARKNGVSSYRLYDADMPEYAFAIDLYQTLQPDATWLYVQEYAAPAEIELEASRRRRSEALSVLPEVTGVPRERIRVRVRRRMKRGEQYTGGPASSDRPGSHRPPAQSTEIRHFHLVEEGGCRFRVNFEDYLDTGLFLDHRLTRSRLRSAAAGKRFLNLFCYTATATVYAASGGAVSSTSVDLSRAYLDWAHRNLTLNEINLDRHVLVQADCLKWLEEAGRSRERFDLVFVDPPTFSNSKRMEGVLDLDRDHPALLDACARLLAPQGLIVFSTNSQRFRLDPGLTERYAITDISAATLPVDFERNPRIHRCYEVRPGYAV
ncbi:MAG TPA: bifunctional 23S rRNA (guanine(2069)-N(7))-methyltransferase RlmK/23S rRNA (guanine(2445)-N(2))-methyltransferase RlmL [Steroidobacteraceae bacterium]|nr:bifunctional 23S rRNA (guanine(2069)-N(7))-methyltransferase RlmK/23S rRNA (guanine(2445)-N(2))-methyltransferase RlmL [Steroidobacteraceae bacterium]